MTTTATLTLAEEPARKAAGEIADALEIGADAVDLHEAGPDRWQVIAYFGEADRSQRMALDAIARQIGGQDAEPLWGEVAETDWVARSQAALPPVRAGRIVVYGHHDRDKIRPNDIAIAIEAAQAFGTGHHGTTQGCLLAIQDVQKSAADPVGAGCRRTGSGVLAIALARRGARVLATEINAVSAAIARQNARDNPGRGPDRCPHDAGAAGVAADRPAHAGIRPGGRQHPDAAPSSPSPRPSRARSGRGGTVILSGLLPEQRVPIVATYRMAGLRLKRWFILDGWLTAILERPGSERRLAALRLGARLR